MECGLDASGSGQGPMADSCEHGNEPSCSIKSGEFVDWMLASSVGFCSVELVS